MKLNVSMILAIETSVPEASVILVKDDIVILEEAFTNGRNHNSAIFDAMEKVAVLLQGERLECVIVGTGPGSYSGVRVGIAAAQGIAIVHDCPAIGLGSLAATQEAIAAESSLAIGDARRGLYYISEIAENGESQEPELMEAEEFQKRLEVAASKGKTLFTMDDPEQLDLSDELKGHVTQTNPEAKLLIKLWQKLSPARQAKLSSQPLAPSYLRPPFTSKAKSGHPLLRGN